MITVRKSSERGYTDRGWMNSYRTFSFEEYQDKNYMGYRSLRVINEDRLQPGHGFPSHQHKNMEILTYIINGELLHEDNKGNSCIIHADEVQRMTAGKGIIHSEYNPSQSQELHLLQIWIIPDEMDLRPDYEQKEFTYNSKTSKLCLIASRDGRNNSLKVHQDVNIYAGNVITGRELEFNADQNRYIWIQVISGSLFINDTPLEKGDGASIINKDKIELYFQEKSEILLFDLA